MTETRKITLQFPSLRAFLAQYGERISPEGMLLRSEAPPAPGSEVDIEVVVAEGMRLLRARGETLWSGATGDGESLAAAVRFAELDEASRVVIGKIVDQRRRQGAEPLNLADVPGPREARLRELTVPAAEPPGPATGGEEMSVFDLEAPPPEPVADLFSSAAEETITSAERPSAARRVPAPPVPLLDEADSMPFDLPLEDELEPDAGGEASRPPREVEMPEAEGAATSGGEDLNDLFGAEEPPRPPAAGRTEAFPASFVDEVEAELEAGDEEPGSSYRVVDTDELEIQLDAPPKEVGEVGAPEPVEALESAAEVGPPAAEAATTQPADPAPSATTPLEERPEVEAAGGGAPPTPAVPPDSPEWGEPPGEEPGGPAAEAAPPPTPEPEALRAELASRVDRAFAAERGAETVEIPIIESPLAKPPAEGAADEKLAGESVPEEPSAPEEELEGAPPVVVTSPAATPPPAGQAPTQALDDNLLSIPELGMGAASEAPQSAGVEPAEPAAPMEPMRGAAGRSRHLGTWLLIALLTGALGAAGYLIFGLARNGGVADTEEAPQRADAPLPETAPAPAAADANVEGPEAAPAEDSPQAPSEPEAQPVPGEEPAAGPAEAATEASGEPLPPLTGLSRITWTESAGETVLAMEGDGEFTRQIVDLVPIGGETPRLVIKISGVERPFQPAVLEIGTGQVQRVRTGLHPGGQLHVVVDLAAPGIAARSAETVGNRLEVRLGGE